MNWTCGRYGKDRGLGVAPGIVTKQGPFTAHLEVFFPDLPTDLRVAFFKLRALLPATSSYIFA